MGVRVVKTSFHVFEVLRKSMEPVDSICRLQSAHDLSAGVGMEIPHVAALALVVEKC